MRVCTSGLRERERESEREDERGRDEREREMGACAYRCNMYICVYTQVD